MASAVNESIPFMHLVPANTQLPPLPVNLAVSAELHTVFDLKSALGKAPIKCLVTLMAGVNGRCFLITKRLNIGSVLSGLCLE